MKKKTLRKVQVLVLGDSFNNTLGLIRSLGETGVRPVLILIGDDRLFISKSRYIDKVFQLDNLSSAFILLKELSTELNGAYLICSNDAAAEFIDDNESILSKWYITPIRGEKIGNLFEKENQCELASECGVTIPFSFKQRPSDKLPDIKQFPVLIKPNDSNYGSKSDIHICRNSKELTEILATSTGCPEFIIQEYIEKEYEINLIGVASPNEIYIPGGIKKLRHYPTLQSPCSFGVYLPIKDLPVNLEPLITFVKKTGYNGPFSIELLHAKDKNFFMEMNFRHDGLAYAATAAGFNLLDCFINDNPKKKYSVHKTYMMDISTDYCHVKNGDLSKRKWFKDFIRTKCQLNFNLKDPVPTLSYYLNKLKH